MGGRRLNYGPRFRATGLAGGKLGLTPTFVPPKSWQRPRPQWLNSLRGGWAKQKNAVRRAAAAPDPATETNQLRDNLELLMRLREDGCGQDRTKINFAIARIVKRLHELECGA